ncbi:hypothetical protein ABBQ38_000713 [Trebouxia sp. C0009 RCD-2024]
MRLRSTVQRFLAGLNSSRGLNTDLDHLLGRAIEKGYRRKDESGSSLLTTRSEAIALYRHVWRYSRLFVWHNEQSKTWRDVLRQSARQEYELARHEQDPELISRMIVSGRDAVHQVVEKFMAKRDQMEQDSLQPSNGEPGPST